MVDNQQSMDGISDLNETDRVILRLLATGRETRGSLAKQMEKHENYVGERLKWLRAFELIAYRHEETALYEITAKGEEWQRELADEQEDRER